ncbi:MAG: class I SAM-dependent methyltransferase [Bacteroidetes bacterium]|nr:class I SAM-dependent methyltransferase [Bacteroidota bacterium]MDA1122436.1 class I SAM-dependent methyltransferase [Bacteroidota bacterium]
MNVEEFYDSISKEYADLLDRTIPRYREMLSTLFHYIPDDFAPKNILELGCGTGNLTEQIIHRYPASMLTVVDLSSEMIEACRSRFKSINSISYDQTDFRNLKYEGNSFDLVISSISIHHIADSDKQLLFDKVYSFIKPNGVFTFADQCKGSTTEIYQKHMDAWKREAFKLGSTGEDWNIWMDHQERHDFHAAAEDQLIWLTDASFKNIDIVWRNLLWTVFYAEKSK